MASYPEANDAASADVIAAPAVSQQQNEYTKQESRPVQEQEPSQVQDHLPEHHHHQEQQAEHQQHHEEHHEQHHEQSHPQEQDQVHHAHEHYNHQQLVESAQIHSNGDANHNHSHLSSIANNATAAVTTAASSSPTSSSLIANADSYDHTTSATIVAHHGLQVLQAASAAPLSPITSNEEAQHYAQSAALQMGESQFAPALVNQPIATHVPGTIPGTMPGPPASSQKVTRLRRACDMCSQRKVKCDESGPPCKPCSDLQVECTFLREMKRRGPPNKHAEAARAAKRLETDNGMAVQHNTAEPLVAIATTEGHVALDAEAIAPFPVLQLLVDDFFTYIHPLLPFPHEPSFRQAFVTRADRTNREFLSLLASMIGILVASFPRSARAHLKAQNAGGLFPTAITMIDHCRSVALEARGAGFMSKQDVTVDDAVASYFLGLAAGNTLRPKLCRRFLAEAMSFCRELGIQRPRDLASSDGQLHEITAAINSAANKPIDHIKDQISKRIFWALTATIRSMSLLGASMNELPQPPSTTQEPYPEEPVEVDDEYIFAHQILPQPEGTISLITGFNRNTRLFMSMNELVGCELCYGLSFFDWHAQKNIIGNGLVACKQTVDDLPPQLQIIKTESESDSAELDQAGLAYCPPAFPQAQPENDVRRVLSQQPIRRRQLQCEIQKVQIRVSHLTTRAYYVERYMNLRDAYLENAQEVKDERDDMVAEEREAIVQDLLAIMQFVRQRNLEPHAQPTISRLRQIGTTLVHGAPKRKGPIAVKAEESLMRFLEILAKVERCITAVVVGSGIATVGPEDEDNELRSWHYLRECQVQHLASSGGVLGGGI